MHPVVRHRNTASKRTAILDFIRFTPFDYILPDENCSCSNLGDAQARRLKIRVKGEDGKMYLPHTLNNTVVAPPRMLIAFLENHLRADGSVTIPEVLRPYMGGKEVLIPCKK